MEELDTEKTAETEAHAGTQTPTPAEPEISPERENENREQTPEPRPDFAALAGADLSELKIYFPEMAEETDLSALRDPERYGTLRELGLTPAEAYRAVGKKQTRADNRSHLQSAYPRAAHSAYPDISDTDLAAGRELFSDMSDSEIRRLYKQVTR